MEIRLSCILLAVALLSGCSWFHRGHKAPTEVDTWTILDDKLYFNYNQKVKDIWTKDKPGYIQKADKQWPEIKGKE